MLFTNLIVGLLCMMEVSPFQLAISQTEEDGAGMVYDLSTRRPFCYPTEEMMRLISNHLNGHNWGITSSFNFTLKMDRVGQVMCHQLGFTFMESISPSKMKPTRSRILWAASCLGFEALISQCIFLTFEDEGMECQDYVSLRCKNCYSILSLKGTEIIEIKSPGFPNLYTDNSMCEWIITSDDSPTFMITIEHLLLPARNKYGYCARGLLEIEGKHGNSTFNALTLCGSSERTIFYVNSSSLNIRWISGIFHPRPYGNAGFSIRVQMLQKPTVKVKSNSSQSTDVPIIAGITIGVLATLIIFVVIGVVLKQGLVKFSRVRSRRQMARVLTVQEKLKTPGVGPRPNGESLPSFPKQTVSFPSDPDRKTSLNPIYEDINSSYLNFQTSYLALDEVLHRSTLSPKDAKLKGSREDVSSSSFDFQIPTLKVTSWTESEISTTSWRSMTSQSEPSDMPSMYSPNSEDDSVFEKEKSLLQETKRDSNRNRKETYTVNVQT